MANKKRKRSKSKSKGEKKTPLEDREKQSPAKDDTKSENDTVRAAPVPMQDDRGEKQPEVTKTDKKKKNIEKSTASDRESEHEGGKDEKAEEDATDEEESNDEAENDEAENDEEEDDDDDEEEEEEEEKQQPLFSDENAAWLKPKRTQLIPSDEEDEEEDVEDVDDEEGLLEIEKEAQLVDAEMEAEREEAEAEFNRTMRQETSVFHLPTPEELENEVNRVVPPSEIRARVESVLEVLTDFRNRRELGRNRSEYVDRFVEDVASLHGYLPELVEYFVSMLGPSEALEFVQASDRPRPLVVRTNTLKTRRKDLAAALMKRGVRLDPLASWSKVGLKIAESPVPIGATPEYLSGQYMLQSAASMCPVLALSPQPNEKVLDMAAAPGGKTSYIAQLMRNTGTVLANDLRADRQKATVANTHRLGVKNVITCKHDGRKLGDKFRNSFDRVLLDAPCSGLGVISRDPSVKVQRTVGDVQKCAHLQKELILAAIDALNHKKSEGVLVYSTCSVSVHENEEVVNYALSKRDIKIVDTGLEFGKPGFTRCQQKRFHPTLALTRRFYPHVHNMDGFYVAKILKLSDRKPQDSMVVEEGNDEKPLKSKDDEEEMVDIAAAAAAADDDNNNKNNDKEAVNEHKTRRVTKRKGAEKPTGTNKKVKNDRISVPPKDPGDGTKKPKKKKTNAKVTKPRRKKITQPMEEVD